MCDQPGRHAGACTDLRHGRRVVSVSLNRGDRRVDELFPSDRRYADARHRCTLALNLHYGLTLRACRILIVRSINFGPCPSALPFRALSSPGSGGAARLRRQGREPGESTR